MERQPIPEVRPERRLAPRPLPANLLGAMTLWLSSRAALPILNSVLPPSSAAAEPLRQLAQEIAPSGADRVGRALDAEIARRAQALIDGLEAYRRHPFRRPVSHRRVVWRAGTTRLLDYGRGGQDAVVLVVPSLINRFYVLDLLPERSFLRFLAEVGLRPLVVDWGMPGAAERHFTLDDYILQRLEPALAAARALAGRSVAVLGYCMGGLLALALAMRHRRAVGGLALLATPWDFHAERAAQARLLGLVAEWLPRLGEASGMLPVSAIQSLFLSLDPFLAERKFVRFAALDQQGATARSFVALEDWINDGVPLAGPLARQCARSWYRDNEPGRGLWQVGGERVSPGELRSPALVVLPGRDRIVPPASAAPLAEAIGGASVLRPPLGHIGMMTAADAPAALWAPLAEWLRARLDTTG